MKVTLIDYTHDAINKLIYTKSTRLTQGKDTREQIKAMSHADKMKELEYMARTIPSSWEFIVYTFEILGVTRAFTHQFVRTRTGSYAQQTMRLLKQENFGYHIGPSVIVAGSEAAATYHNTMAHIQQGYNRLLELGVLPEDARGVLPTNIHTNIIAQFNMRTLSEMLRSRTGGRTQGEYRKVAQGMLDEILAVHPWAELFLVPKPVQRLKELERCIHVLRHGGDGEGRYNTAIKIIDQLKKEA